MQKVQIRRVIDIDTQRQIVMAARARPAQDIVKVPMVDFVASMVAAKYNLRIQEIRGTELGKAVDALGERLRQEMLQKSLKEAAEKAAREAAAAQDIADAA